MSNLLDSVVKIGFPIIAAITAFLVGLFTSSIAAGVCTLGGLSLLFGWFKQSHNKQQASSPSNEAKS